MMVMGRGDSNGVPIALLCIPDENPDEKLKFILAVNFRTEGNKPVWDEGHDFSDFGAALKAFMNYEHTGIRSFAAGVAGCCVAYS